MTKILLMKKNYGVIGDLILFAVEKKFKLNLSIIYGFHILICVKVVEITADFRPLHLF